MKKIATISFLSFYLLGTLFLPLGDFSIIRDLPDMYHHCRSTEDADLTVFEFFTEHISPLGQLVDCMGYDDHEDGDGDKPHAPIQLNCQQVLVAMVPLVKAPLVKAIPIIKRIAPLYNDGVYVSDYISTILRPPIVG